MTSALNNPVISGRPLYMCQICEQTFELQSEPAVCPKCGATANDVIVPIYVEGEPEREALLTDDDWHAGD